jgi:hypothetical protein
MRMTSTTCYNCGGLLLEEPLLEYDKKEMLDDADRPSWLEYDGNNHFITCQQCSAMNIVVISEDPDGIPVLTVTRAIMDDQ